MEFLSAWDISSKGLIFSKLFPEQDFSIDEQKNALVNILNTQEFDMIPIVKKAAITETFLGKPDKTITGDITNIAILNESKTDVDLIDVNLTKCIPKDTNLIETLLAITGHQFSFVLLGNDSRNAEAIITPSMVICEDVKNNLILACAHAQSKGKLNDKHADYGIKLFKMLSEWIENKNSELNDELIKSLNQINPKKRVPMRDDSDIIYVPRGEVSAQHVMKFPVAGIRKKGDYILASKMLGQANDFDHLLLYDTHKDKLGDTVLMLNHKEGKPVSCWTVSYDTKLKTIINRMNAGKQVCIVKPNHDLRLKGGERMAWPAIIQVNLELQGLSTLKELGRYCSEVEIAMKNKSKVSPKSKSTIGSFNPVNNNKEQRNKRMKKGDFSSRVSGQTEKIFTGINSFNNARNKLFHEVLGGHGKLNINEMKNIIEAHDHYKTSLERSRLD